MSQSPCWADRADTVKVAPGDGTFWRRLWRHEGFRALLEDPDSGYGPVLDWAASRPWWFITATAPHERRHFGVWFGHAFVRRDYANPLIQDLFHWHDLLHAYTFAMGPFEDFAHWRRAMRANEIAVSIETEVLVYWRAPALRAASFDFPIWADQLGMPLAAHQRERLLRWRVAQRGAAGAAEEALHAALGDWPLPAPADPTAERLDGAGLWALRRAVSAWPRPGCDVERTLADYEAQAEPFYLAWEQDWREVEAARLAFARDCDRGQWVAAVAEREALWRDRADGHGVPYGRIAQELAAKTGPGGGPS